MISENKKQVSALMVFIAFAIVYLVWGSTYIFIKLALESFPPFLLGSIRFLVAGVLLMLFAFISREKIFVWKNIKHALISGLLMLFIGNGAVIWVEQYLPSAMVAIMVSSAPIYFILLDKPKWKENLSNPNTIAGLLIGFVGIVLVFGEKLAEIFFATGNHADLVSMSIMLIGVMAWAGGSLWSKYKSKNGSATVNTAWQMLAAGVAFLPGSIWRNEISGFHLSAVSMEAWLSMGYLILFGSIAGFTAYVWLLKVKSAMQVSTYAYVNPVVALLLGIFFAGERISLLQVGGLVIILSSVFMINFLKNRKKKSKEMETLVSTEETRILKRSIQREVPQKQ